MYCMILTLFCTLHVAYLLLSSEHALLGSVRGSGGQSNILDVISLK